MNKKLIACMACFILTIQISNVDAQTPSYACLNKTTDESECKNCCDCLDSDAPTRRSCRNDCAVHDFSLNSDFIPVNAPSKLGPDGDYSAALDAGSEQACKEYCDGSDALACGDRRYCRDACNAATFNNSGPPNAKESANRPQNHVNKGLPAEIVAACQGKSDQESCSVGGTFTGLCHTLQDQLACVLSKGEAPAELLQQWNSLDGNHDGFLDVNETRSDDGPKDHAAENSLSRQELQDQEDKRIYSYE